MVARYQMILRQGRTRMDLGILRLDYNFNNMIFWRIQRGGALRKRHDARK